jgi:hypothetical protein
MILADHVGLNIMASACFDPKEAVGVWKRMDEHERSSRIARMATEFLQTHPTHGSRIEKVSPFHGELWTMRTGELTHYSGIRSSEPSRSELRLHYKSLPSVCQLGFLK